MAQASPKTAEKTQEFIRPFSKAQLRHFNELSTNIQMAEVARQSFINYLSSEHELDEVELPEGYGWVVGTKGFIGVPNGPQPAPVAKPNSGQPPAPNGTGSGDQGDASGDQGPPAVE